MGIEISWLVLSGCSEYDLNKGKEATAPIDEGQGDLLIEPKEVDFGRIDIDTIAAESVLATNLGDDRVRLTDVLVDHAWFTVAFLGDVVIDPGESTEMLIEYAPLSFGRDESELVSTLR